MRDMGLGKDDKIAILHPNCHYFLEAYYGITQIGAISVPGTVTPNIQITYGQGNDLQYFPPVEV
jgi:long-subunit acyl-CoA synthetase (AMP-forming)